MGVLKVKVNGQWIDVGTSIPQPGRNLVDNGQFMVKQRSTTGFALASTVQWLADRWALYNTGVGVINAGYTGIGVAVLPAGRPRPGVQHYFTIATAEAAGALAAGDFWQMAQGIEGQFLQHLNWGTPGAQPLTVSFDIYSSVAASYVVELYRQEATGRTCSALVTVPAGWSTQKATFPGDVAGPLITSDNASRLALVFAFTAGSTYTSGVLQTAWGNVVNANRWPGLTNTIAATINNQIVVTNIQLEIGAQPTPYEVRDYAQELAKCMRYFERLHSLSDLYAPFGAGFAYGATTTMHQVDWTVTKRGTPSVTFSAPSTFEATGPSAGVVALTAIQLDRTNVTGARLIATASGYTSGQGSFLTANNTNAAYIDVSAEI